MTEASAAAPAVTAAADLIPDQEFWSGSWPWQRVVRAVIVAAIVAAMLVAAVWASVGLSRADPPANGPDPAWVFAPGNNLFAPLPITSAQGLGTFEVTPPVGSPAYQAALRQAERKIVIVSVGIAHAPTSHHHRR